MEQIPTFFRDIATLTPSVGLLSLLTYFLIHVMRQNSSDRNDQNRLITSMRRQHSVELSERDTRHDADSTDYEARITALRVENEELRRELEESRRARWAAEDAAADWRRQAAAARREDGSNGSRWTAPE